MTAWHKWQKFEFSQLWRLEVPGHCLPGTAAAHTPEEGRVLTQKTVTPTGQLLPLTLIVAAIPRGPAARPGAVSSDRLALA